MASSSNPNTSTPALYEDHGGNHHGHHHAMEMMVNPPWMMMNGPPVMMNVPPIMAGYEFLSQLYPPGYRFCPSDAELILNYLAPKILKQALPVNKIIDINLYDYNPMQLAEMHKWREEKEMYFFTPRDKKYPNGKRPSRSAGNGFWKATGVDVHIQQKGRTIGHKKALVFLLGKQKDKLFEKTNWIMHEYTIPTRKILPRTTTLPGDNRLDEWVLCKVYNSKLPKNKPNEANATISDQDEVMSSYNLEAHHDEYSDVPIYNNINGGYTSNNMFPIYNINRFGESDELPPLPESVDFSSWLDVDDLLPIEYAQPLNYVNPTP